MAEPTPPDSVCAPARTWTPAALVAALASLALLLEVALGLRVVAANLLDLYVRRGGADQLCLFPDTRIYWDLARSIRAGAPYEIVEWSDIPHFALRTPGYPLFLAAGQAVFGERTLPVRLVQASLGTVSVYLLYRLVRQLAPAGKPDLLVAQVSPQRWTAHLAAAVAALNPYYIFMSSLLLSEAVFEPLMLAVLCGLAMLWERPGDSVPGGGKHNLLIALSTGAAAGAAILVRPSWSLFVPAVLVIWLIAKWRDRHGLISAARGALVCTLGVALVMAPWWVRNARIYGRFVPTALWFGASLYDGLNPTATGASDMAFLGDREIWPLDEQDQDAELTRRAVAFARREPLRVLELALIKFGRYWSPWPNAEGFRSRYLAVTSTLVELPLFGLIVVGAWDRRRDLRSLVLLGGPVLYFCALHMVFASSARYRIPGEMPAVGLAAFGWMGMVSRRQNPAVRAPSLPTEIEEGQPTPKSIL
jgi:4-amino-4-deoxy-L-arabinose transferase-like glycosyltransferase